METHKIIVPMDNPYIQIILDIFKQYVIEEVTGQGITADHRLSKKIEAARMLYSTERAIFSSAGYFGRFDKSNTELIFCNSNNKVINVNEFLTIWKQH